MRKYKLEIGTAEIHNEQGYGFIDHPSVNYFNTLKETKKVAKELGTEKGDLYRIYKKNKLVEEEYTN